jgi:hypothetical protein
LLTELVVSEALASEGQVLKQLDVPQLHEHAHVLHFGGSAPINVARAACGATNSAMKKIQKCPAKKRSCFLIAKILLLANQMMGGSFG